MTPLPAPQSCFPCRGIHVPNRSNRIGTSPIAPQSSNLGSTRTRSGRAGPYSGGVNMQARVVLLLRAREPKHPPWGGSSNPSRHGNWPAAAQHPARERRRWPCGSGHCAIASLHDLSIDPGRRFRHRRDCRREVRGKGHGRHSAQQVQIVPAQTPPVGCSVVPVQ